MKKLTTMVYIIKNNRILFLVRKKENDMVHRQGVYLSIGGHVENGEGVEECARREVLEESGIVVKDIDLRAILYFRCFGVQKNDTVAYMFTTDHFVGEPKDGREGSFVWVEMDKLDTVDLYPGDRVYFEYLKQYKFFVAEFVYDGHEYISNKLLHVES